MAVELEPRVESCPGGRTAMVIILVMSSLVVVFAWFTYVQRKEQGMPDPWNSIGDCIDFVKHGAYGGSSLFMGQFCDSLFFTRQCLAGVEKRETDHGKRSENSFCNSVQNAWLLCLPLLWCTNTRLSLILAPLQTT